MGKDPSEIRDEIDDTRDEMSETIEAIGYRANVPRRVQDTVSDAVQSVRDKASNATSRVGSRLQSVADNLPSADDVREGARGIVRSIGSNPLVLVLGALAIGFMIGSLIPPTRFEQERVGPLSDAVKQRAREKGGELLERGKRVAQETADAARSSAQREGQEMASQMMETGNNGSSG